MPDPFGGGGGGGGGSHDPFGSGGGGGVSVTPKPSGGGGGSGGSGGSGGGSQGSGGGGGGSVPHFKQQLRNAIGAGDVEKVKRLTAQAGLKDAERKAYIFLAKQNREPTDFLGKVGSEVGSTLANAPAGIAGAAEAAGKEAVALPRVAYKAATGQKVSPDELLGAVPVAGQFYGAARGFIEQKPNPENPFSSGAGVSFRHTANRVTSPSQLVHDYSQHPFNTLLEDAGNVGAATGVSARLARLAGLEKTANVLETGSRTLNQVSAGPFLPVSPLARGANRGLGKLATKIETTPALEKIAAALHQSKAARFAKEAAASEIDQGGQFANETVKSYVKPVEKLLPSYAQQEALFAVAKKQAESLAKVRASSPDTFARFVKENGQAFDNISVKGANIAADFVEGKAGKVGEHIKAALPIATKRAEERSARYLAQGGNPEQLGSVPLTAPVENAVKPIVEKIAGLSERAQKLRAAADEAAARANDITAAGDAKVARQREMTTVGEFGAPLSNVRRAEGDIGGPITGKDINAERAVARTQTSTTRQATRSEARAHMLDVRARAAERSLERTQARASTVRANVENAVTSAPSRLRPVLEANQAAVSHLTEQENRLRAAGLHDQAALVGKAAGELPTTLAALKDAGIDAPHFIRTVERDRGIGGASPTSRVKLSQNKLRTGRGRGVQTVVKQAQAEVKRAKQVIRNETIDKLESSPFAKLAGEFVPENERALQQAPTREQLDAAGYAPLGKGDIRVDTPVLPKEVVAVFDSYHHKAGAFEKVVEHTYDPLTRAFKASVLPLSPSWQVGNAIGNSFMAVAGGGVGPVTLGKNILKSLAEFKKTGNFPGPERLRTHGSTYEAQDRLRAGESAGAQIPVPGKARAVGRHLNPVSGGYRLNEFVDNLGRSAVYMAKKSKGYSDEMALKQSLRAMGDFTKLSPFEKRVVRRVIPFYAWQKHLAKLALSMPIEHPLRTAFTLELANQYQSPEDWQSLLPGYLKGGIPVGGGYLTTSNLFPFGDPLQGYQNVKGGLNPLIKLGLTNIPGSPAQGENLFTGKPYSRPSGTGRFNEAGQALPTAPSLLEQIAGISPQVRAYRDLSGRNNIARYEDGSPVLIRDPKTGKRVPIPTNKDDASVLLGRLGINIKTKADLQAFVDSIIARKVTNYKTAHPAAIVK